MLCTNFIYFYERPFLALILVDFKYKYFVYLILLWVALLYLSKQTTGLNKLTLVKLDEMIQTERLIDLFGFKPFLFPCSDTNKDYLLAFSLFLKFDMKENLQKHNTGSRWYFSFTVRFCTFVPSNYYFYHLVRNSSLKSKLSPAPSVCTACIFQFHSVLLPLTNHFSVDPSIRTSHKVALFQFSFKHSPERMNRAKQWHIRLII